MHSVRFSPTGQSWSAVTTEGLLMYSLESGIVFDPLNLALEITPKTIRHHLTNEDFSNALLMSLRLNESSLTEEVIEKMPISLGIHEYFLFHFLTCSISIVLSSILVELVVSSLPDIYAQRILDFVAQLITTSQHIEFYLHWLKCLLNVHGAKNGVLKHQSLLAVQDSITRKYELLTKICDFNKYTLQVLVESSESKYALEDIPNEADQSETEEEDGNDDGSYILLNSRRLNGKSIQNKDHTILCENDDGDGESN